MERDNQEKHKYHLTENNITESKNEKNEKQTFKSTQTKTKTTTQNTDRRKRRRYRNTIKRRDLNKK